MPECAEIGCATGAKWGPTAESKPVWCGTHAKPRGGVKVVQPKCEMCSERARFALHRDDRPRWCRTHGKPRGAFDVAAPLCELCDLRATHGEPGGKRRWCTKHGKERGFDDINSPKCQDCDKHATHGPAGGRAKWCGSHGKRHGAVNVRQRSCEECGKQPNYGLEDGKPRWCAEHGKPHGATNVKQRRCEECDDGAFWGLRGTTEMRWCAEHAEPHGAICLKTWRCQHDDCDRAALFAAPGEGRRWCQAHAPSGSSNLSVLTCDAGCGTIVGTRGALCATCRGGRTRVRERRAGRALANAGLHWTSSNKQLAETACGRYRPDFVYETATHVVVVEVDEHQHASPGYACDNARMLDVYNSYGGMPVAFVRWNPDRFKIGGEAVNVPVNNRLPVLVRHVREALAAPPVHPLTIVRLFYDGARVARTRVDPCDPAFTEHALV